MKLAIIAMTAALSAAAIAPAQAQQREQPSRETRAGRMDPAKRIERRVQMLTQQLDLSAEQATKIKAILTQEGEQMKAFLGKRDPAGDAQPLTEEQRKSIRAEMQKVREQTSTEITKVLNADQLEKYEELRKQRSGQRGERAPARKT
jgi:hypothetical protein